ncbi:hypothetical protein [Ruegeria lacuscaerulensis]|uniref:hypothetical protein n=1 Tax=Ruegeria lacuscaerulensis TaxID=55218 RepID=UPI00148017F0|nr:hypothetical protein [Ruegeria lacuscaerulensis]
MVQNNKVLTVSYGTFSCTLEGFDDSFETMKAIAEYFRDLAADDRYFGSEPPQPDTEMLTRIAQRDASRKVEASQSDSGLLIRATEDAASQPGASAADLNVVNTPQTTPPPSHAPQPFFAEAEPVEEPSPPAADSIAAKLQRIRAVVSHSEENSVIYTEDEETTMKSAGPVDAVAAAFEAGSLNPADLDGRTDTDADAETAEDAPVEALANTTAVEPDEEPVEALDETQDVADTLVESAMPQDQEEEQTNAPVSESQLTELALEEDEPTETLEDQDEEVSALSDILFSDIDETEEPEPEDEDLINILSDEASDDASDKIEEGILTEEDEIHLLSEISSVETVLANRAADPAPDASSMDQDVLRLMDQVGEQLDKPEASNKRETYSHMRAAVAVTEAERNDAGGNKQDDKDQGFRDDLTSAVSPRRPEVQVTSMRPEAVAAAPLKLVAEQRVDNQDGDTGPVTPRRVTTDSEDEAAEEGGFALFAQEQGAQSLPDLLEAAAAYLSFIEGQEQFSRPQLMNKIRSLKQDDFNREESLRSFGQLLRDGKIEKAGGGRFAASTQIGFRPDDERAAG